MLLYGALAQWQSQLRRPMIKIGVEVAILQGSEVSSNKCPANWITLWRSCSRPLIKDLLLYRSSFYSSPYNRYHVEYNGIPILIFGSSTCSKNTYKVHLNIAGSTGAPPAIGAQYKYLTWETRDFLLNDSNTPTEYIYIHRIIL